MNVVSITRQVYECKDRVGAVRTIAAYTDSRSLPGATAGKILRWKGPRYHWFVDGSSGARVEQEDLGNVTISDVWEGRGVGVFLNIVWFDKFECCSIQMNLNI